MSEQGLGSVTISGLNELEKRLSVFSDKVSNQIVRQSVLRGIRIFRAEAELKAPKSEKKHRLKVSGKYIDIFPGNLKKNIKIQFIRKVPKGTIRYQVFVKKKEAWYAGFVERGTSRMGAQPFVATAFEAKLEEVKQVFKDTVLQGIRNGGF